MSREELRGRRTLGAYASFDEAKAGAQHMVRLWNGVPVGYRLWIIERMGAFVLCTLPEEYV